MFEAIGDGEYGEHNEWMRKCDMQDMKGRNKDQLLEKLILSYVKAKNSQKILTVAGFFIQSRTLATIAQLVEHRFCKPTVISSSLIGGSTSVKFEVRLNIWVGSRVVKWGGL